MRLCSGAHWSVFVDAGISPHLIFLTAGELGISKESTIQPAEMAIIRHEEALYAAEYLNATLTLLSFPDLQLPFVPIQDLIAAVLPIIRNMHADAVFSFDPYETTHKFDHPDHNVAGLVAKHVGAAADVKHFMPESTALGQRPELYLWTSDQNKVTHQAATTPQMAERREEFLVARYPSQFQESKKGEWIEVFDAIKEGYIKVR